MNCAASKSLMEYDAGVIAMGLSCTVRRLLLRSMMMTFPISGYLWTIGVIMTGVLYMISPTSAPPPDIPYVPDIAWGLLLMTVGSLMMYSMIVEKPKWVSVLSFLISVFAVTLFIASVVNHRPVAMISSSLTSVYYAYAYLCAHLTTEWRHIDDDRLSNLRDKLKV